MKSTIPTAYQQFIHKSRYARWLDNECRREDWDETVSRYLDFIERHVFDRTGVTVDKALHDRLFNAIVNLEVMPSMRAMMSAGPALERDNTAGYNCSYLPVDSIESFDEAMYILLCGTGVGFSVERQYVSQLPSIPHLTKGGATIVVPDSKEGWAQSLRKLITALYGGHIPDWDVSEVRPAGSRLKTFGGRASGPEPLVELFDFVVATFKAAQGRTLTSIEAHDIMCKIGEVVVVGGVRRSALISLSNLSDKRMAAAKAGAWWENNGQRALANNSVAYTEKPDVGAFMEEWLSLYNSKSGERGIFNRVASVNQAAKSGRRDPNHEWGTNPCSEIILRPYQFCNLTEVVIRADDTRESLMEKVTVATILGTFQSTLTTFPYLRQKWTDNTREERLLGVSLTGIMDNTLTNGLDPEDLPDLLWELRETAVDVNRRWAELLEIPQSAAITCVKPSGTVSQLVDSASGIHARHSEYYIRTVRAANNDPLTQFLKDAGVQWEPDFMKPDQTTVFSFPIKSPEGAVFRTDMTAIEQLELWLTYQRYWCEHKPSVTISVKEHEWPEVGGWVYRHFDELSGVSFLPHSDHTYQQAPYQECDRETYEALLAKTPETIDWDGLQAYERSDNTKGSRTLACSGDVCEVVDL